MAAATTPLQTLSRRAGNYAPKATTSPSLLGGVGEEAGQDGTGSRRGGLRVGTAQGGRSTPSARQGQLPFDSARQAETQGAGGEIEPVDQEVQGLPTQVEAPVEVPSAVEPTTQERVIAKETVVIRRRELIVERAMPATSGSGLRTVPKPALRRIVLDDVEERQPKAAFTQETVPAPRRELPIVLEAVGTVAVTALGLAALLFLG